MKKLTSLLILMILSSSVLFAQMHTPEQIAQKKMIANGIKPVMSIVDADINAVTNPHATTVTDDLFDYQFDFICGDASGEAGIETNGDYIYTSKWNGDGFFCYEMDGTFLGWFPVAGEAAVRDMAYDGTYFYGAAANTALYEMDFVGQSGTLISTLTAAVATRACAYDAEFDGFWGNNWSDPITLYDRTGGILNQFNCGAYSSYYGFARLDDAGSQWLYGFAQSGGASQSVIVQIDPYTGAETGVTFDAIIYSTTGTGIAGGLAAFDTWAPGWWTLLGIIQNEAIYGVEGGIAGPPPDLDLKLTGIQEPNTGFGLGVENIVVGVKNVGAITQSNFDVQYRVDGGTWYTEMIAGPLAMGESIAYTFATPYDFSAFGEYYIEAEVILAGDEHPENNSADKTIENWDPSAWCEYSITMWDDYGDGWNGGFVEIFGDGTLYGNFSLASGAGPETVYFLVGDGAFLTSVWTAGGWPYECSYEVFDADGNSIFQDGFGGVDPIGGDIGYASCVPPPPVDGGTVSILSPVSGMLLGIEPVTAIFKNFGADPLPDIPVGFDLDGAGWVYETVPGPVGPGEEVEYTFTAMVDLTVLGTYVLDVCTFVPGDEDPVNDCQQAIIENVEGFYCPASTVTEDEWIAFVDFGLIQNASGWQGGVADYTDQFNNVAVGVPAEMIVTNGNPWASDEVSVWCDWNDDFEFDDLPGSIEKYDLTNDGTGAVFTGDITAPPGAIEGPHRMRVRMVYAMPPFPCGESSYGEVEDYTIVVGPYEPPEITWDPGSFDVLVDVGGTAQDALDIGNIGAGPALWNLAVVYPPMETTAPTNVNAKAEPNASITDKDPIANSDWDYDCPAGSVVSQPCPDYSTAMTADEAGYYDFYQSFSGGGEIQGIRFWGIDAIFSGGWAPCTGTEPKTFHIGFYADDGGQPGAMIDEFTMEVPRVNTGDLFASSYTMWEYEAVLPNSVTVVDGWFSVMAMIDPAPCWFLTLNAPSGAGTGQQWDGTAWNAQDPMGFCLLGEVVIPWLTVGPPLSGTLMPQETETIPLNFNAGDWPAGTELMADLVLTSNDPVNPVVNIPVTMTVGGCEPYFEFEGGDPSSPIWTIYFSGATLEENDLEAGDQIAIFDGDIMVGLFDLTQVCTPENQFENDLTAFSVLTTQPGYQAGNDFSFKCWDCSEQVMADFFLYEFFDPYGDAYMGDVFPAGDGEYSIADVDFFTIVSQTFNLNLGFQFISSAVDPGDPDMIVVLDEILNANLDFVRNSAGQMLRKIGPIWVNGIGNWIVEEGYLVKMFAPDTFTIYGAPVDPGTPIDVELGFQFVSYFPAAAMDALVAFETIIGPDLDFIRNSAGQMLRKIGPIWVNGIGDAMPGEGYLVKMFAPGQIIYPAPVKLSGKTTINPSHLLFEGGNAAEPVYTMYIDGLEIGDEVAAYNGDVVLGSMAVTSDNVYNNALPVFSQLTNGQGYVAGEPISLKVWSNDNVVMAEFEMESVYNSYVSTVYPGSDGEFSVVNITKGAVLSGELVVYPNPATNMINISSPNQINSVVIYNYVGQSVYEGNSTQINTGNFESGVYIIRIETANGIETQKVTIN